MTSPNLFEDRQSASKKARLPRRSIWRLERCVRSFEGIASGHQYSPTSGCSVFVRMLGVQSAGTRKPRYWKHAGQAVPVHFFPPS